MGKSHRGNKEYTREQRLIHENQRLKREVSALRKHLARLDLDRYSQVREIIESHYQEERAQEGQDILDKMKQEWKCHECQEGFLEIFTYNKVGKIWYYRICSGAPRCKNRTLAQPYSPNVKGIIRKTT